MVNSNAEYSVVIRTMGDGGEKFATLLKSVENQTRPAKEVIVVIPDDAICGTVLSEWMTFPLPGGGEKRLVRSRKGMVSQRVAGIAVATGEDLLVLDDDLEFEPELVESLQKYKITNNLDCVLPMCGRTLPNDVTSPLVFRKKVLITRFFTGQLFTSKNQSEYMDVITCTAGHKVFTSCIYLDKCYKVQTGNFQIFYINAEVARNIHFEEDLYLEQGTLSQYAAYDDATFFYKTFLRGYTTAYALRCNYRHLDASAGHKSKSILEEKCIRYYSTARARLIFWYKYILNGNRIAVEGIPHFNKFQAFVGALYGFTNYNILTIAASAKPKYWKAIGAMFKGYRDALCTIREFNS